jgi:eukaryotic-like serine/threonine-protein kinase
MNEPSDDLAPDERIDAVLESFEHGWRPEEFYLRQAASDSGFDRDALALSELVRADLDRRYSINLDVELSKYLDAFPVLGTNPRVLAAISFEDFRARRSRGLSTEPARWSGLPGVAHEPWFQQLRLGSLEWSSRQFAVSEEESKHHAGPVGTAEPQVGQTFGDFQLIALLGAGAFSKVFLATQQSLARRYVALKVVRHSLSEPAKLARLQHTGIVPLFSFHRIREYSVLCMPYYGAATLADWLSHGSMDSTRNGETLVATVRQAQRNLTRHVSRDDAPRTHIDNELESVRRWNEEGARPLGSLKHLDTRQSVLWLGQRLAAALVHAHERGVVHGDLKPANILIRNDGEPALIDFNLSNTAECPEPLAVGGTLPYMSPEQLQAMLGRTACISPTSDIYSLGVILYEVIEGRLPASTIVSTAESDLASALQQRRSESISFTSKTATSGTQAIVRKCLSFGESGRYASAAELLEDIEREQDHLPLAHARDPFCLSRFPKFIRRHPGPFSAMPIAIASLLVMAIVAWGGLYWKARSQSLAATAQLEGLVKYSESSLVQFMDASPSELRRAVQATPELIATHLDVGGPDIAASPMFRQLDAKQRDLAAKAVFDHCLVIASFALEKANYLERKDWEAVDRLLSVCHQFPELAQQSRRLTIANSRTAEALGTPSQGTRLLSLPGLRRDARPLEVLLEARAMLSMGKPHSAIQLFQSLPDIPSPEALFWMTLGGAQLHVGQHAEAEMSFTLVIAMASDSLYGYRSRAEVRMAQNNWEGAEKDFTDALRLDPTSVTLLANRALVRERLKKLDESKQDLDNALSRQPGSNRLLFVRARVLRQLGQSAEAMENYRQAMREMPATVNDWISRALAHLPRHPEMALADLRRAEERDPYSLDVKQNLAHVLSEHLKDFDGAILALDEILLAQPLHEMARGGRCVLLARQQRTDESLTDIKFLTSSFDRLAPATVYQIGCAYALLSPQCETCREQAVTFVTRAVRAGYGAKLLQRDPDLDPIRELGPFQTLLAFAELAEAGDAPSQ